MSLTEYITNCWINKVPSRVFRQSSYKRLGMSIGDETAIFRNVEILNATGIGIEKRDFNGNACSTESKRSSEDYPHLPHLLRSPLGKRWRRTFPDGIGQSDGQDCSNRTCFIWG